MTLREAQEIFARNVAKLIEFIFDSGYTCTLGEAFRTKEQALIYAEKGIGSATSLHCKRLAIDLNIFKDGEYLTKSEDYEFAGIFWMALHEDNTWGGAGADGNHFSMGGTSTW